MASLFINRYEFTGFTLKPQGDKIIRLWEKNSTLAFMSKIHAIYI